MHTQYVLHKTIMALSALFLYLFVSVILVPDDESVPTIPGEASFTAVRLRVSEEQPFGIEPAAYG